METNKRKTHILDKKKKKFNKFKNKDGMVTNYNENNFDGMKVFANKEPQWNEGFFKQIL